MRADARADARDHVICLSQSDVLNLGQERGCESGCTRGDARADARDHVICLNQ